MIKKRSKVQKRLAKVVMAALLCTNVVQAVWVPSLAEAESLSYRIETDSKTVTIAGGLPGVRSYGNVRVVGYSPDYLYSVDSEGETAINNLATGNYSGYTINVNWDGGTLGDVRGAYSNGGTVTENTVNITGGSVNQVMGAYSAGGTVTENTVNLSGGTVNDIFGGYSTDNDATSAVGDAKDNHVNITGGTVTGDVVGGGVYSYTGAVALSAEGNTVKISGGTIGTSGENSVLGGENNDIGRSGSARTANKNTVEITGGTINSTIWGGYSSKGDVESNTVNISGGTVTSNVTGGESRNNYGPSEGNATGNTVNISGGTIGREGGSTSIYGGVAPGTDKSASNNTVTISGNPTFVGNVSIYGGTAFSGSASNNKINILIPITVEGFYGGLESPTNTGNTLNIAAKNVVANNVGGFQNMNFYLPKDVSNNDTMLTIKGNEGMTTPANVQGITFGVAALQGVNLQKGDTVNLLVGKNGLTMDDTLKTTDSATLAKEPFLSPNSLTTDKKYELSISKKGEDTIIATVDNVTEQKADEGGSGEKGGSGKKAVSIPDVLKSPVETRAGVVTLVNAGADLLVSQGMSNAADAAAAERTEGDAAAAPRAGGFAPFAAVSFGKLRAESGSHVDNKGIGMNLGFAREIANKNGKLLVGPVIEYGHGSYDSYQDSGIKADGKSSYWGIGVIAKQTNDNGFYYEGSLRAGRTKSDYNSDLRPGLHVNYDSSATYWAAHLGVGKLEDIGHDNTLDYYGKYFYSHTGSDSTYLNGANETANFDAVNSHRIRLGARLTHALNEKNKIYGGLAWQYEFKGDARATYSVSGEAPSPSVKGSSGMIELGWQVKPGKSPMTIDLGVTGWVGKQRGITANLQANWTF